MCWRQDLFRIVTLPIGDHMYTVEMEAQVDSFGPNSDDSFRTVELMGPPTLDVWMDIYQVMITAFITHGTLDLGMTCIQGSHPILHSRYVPETRLLPYQVRVEHIE